MFRSICITALGLASTLCIAQSSASNQAGVPTLRVTTRLVYVDVLVRDAHGGVVKGLKAQDFQVFEDGHPQAIEFFSAHGRALNRGADTELAPPAAPNEFTNVSPGGSPQAITLVLCDLLNTPVDDQLTARQDMLKFLHNLPSGEPLLLFTLGNKLQMTKGVSGDQALLDAASKMLQPRDKGLIDPRSETAQDAQAASNAAIQFGPHFGSTAAENAQKITEADTYEVRARSTISALQNLARSVAGFPGRKSLYWLAEDFPLSIELAGAALNTDPSGGSAAQFDTRVTPLQGHFSQTSRGEMLTTLNELASARIAVYPTSIFGLPIENNPGPTLSGATMQGANAGDARGGFFRFSSMKTEMNTLARETGGEAIFGRNDLADALLQSVADSESYYTVAYKPSDGKWNGEFRKITVEAGHGTSLIYRRGYFATPDESATDSADTFELAMRPGAPEETALRLRSRILPADSQHPGVTIESTIDTSDVPFASTPDGHKQAKLLVQMIAFNDSAQQPKVLPQTSGTLNIDLDPQRYQFILSAGIAFRQRLQLKPGKYRLLVGVNDENSHSMGTIDIPVIVPAS
jgi:VWFA-related protein